MTKESPREAREVIRTRADMSAHSCPARPDEQEAVAEWPEPKGADGPLVPQACTRRSRVGCGWALLPVRT